MGIKFRDLTKTTKAATVEYQGEKVGFTYKPSAITPQMQLVAIRMQTLGEEKGESAPAEMAALMGDFVGVITNLIASWDVLGDDGSPLPVNREWVSQMPLSFLSALFGAAVEDMRPNDESAGS